MRIAPFLAFTSLVALAAVGACTATPDNGLFGSGGGGSDSSGDGTPAATGSGQGGATGQGGDIGFGGGDFGTGGNTQQTTCDSAPDEDKDKDGFTSAQGDCNDCDPNVNPNAVEVVATPDADGGVPAAADEDCDGNIDNVQEPCDQGVVLDTMDPFEGA
jgi:hypothetical protein